MRFRLLNIFLLITLLLTSTANAQWRLDGASSDQLRNFRIDDQLQASASGQPSVAAFETLRDQLPRGFVIWDVDLRQESHGFANAVPVSWYEEHNAANAGVVDSAVVERDEIDRLNALIGHRETFVPLGKADIKALKPLKFKVKSVCTERDAASAVGFKYIRFTDNDMGAPDARVAKQFVDFVEQLPPNVWLHFHCQAGMGRATLFMVLYDIIKNPDKSLEEIAARQIELGGADLLAENNGDDWYAQRHRERAAMIREFYAERTARR